jgi:hypothetical protein
MPDWLWLGWGPSAVEVAAPAPAIGLGPELPLKLHEAPDPGAVRSEIGLDGGSQLADGGQVDAEQLGATVQRRRDRPAQIRVVPSPHRNRLQNTCSGLNPESCRPRWGLSGGLAAGPTFLSSCTEMIRVDLGCPEMASVWPAQQD